MKYNKFNQPLKCYMKNSTCYKQTDKMNILGILVHSTGANNPYLSRYVQPHETDNNYEEMVAFLGKNKYNNDWNHITHQAGLNAWIGKNAYDEIITIQTLPWNYRPWGCGSGKKGSCNKGWIQFEIAEDSLQDKEYFNKVYTEACELMAYLCKNYNIDPMGSISYNGIQVPTILCHQDAYKLGLGSNHGDIYHWFPKHGKNMDTMRKDIKKLLDEDKKLEEKDIVTQEQFNLMMDNWIAEQADKQGDDWSKEERKWAEKAGLIRGDQYGRTCYKKFLTREEFAVVLHRILKEGLK